MDRVDASESFTRRSLPRALSHYVRPNWSLLLFKRRAAEALIQYVYSTCTRTCTRTGKIKVFMSLINNKNRISYCMYHSYVFYLRTEVHVTYGIRKYHTSGSTDGSTFVL